MLMKQLKTNANVILYLNKMQIKFAKPFQNIKSYNSNIYFCKQSNNQLLHRRYRAQSLLRRFKSISNTTIIFLIFDISFINSKKYVFLPLLPHITFNLKKIESISNITNFFYNFENSFLNYKKYVFLPLLPHTPYFSYKHYKIAF